MIYNISRNIINRQLLKALHSQQHIPVFVRTLPEASRKIHNALINFKKNDGKLKVDQGAAKRIKQLQEHYQKDNGIPIFLKNGTLDQTLYRLTLVLVVIGIIEMCSFLVRAALK